MLDIRYTAKGKPYQLFNGKKFYLHKGEKYFSAHEKRMHVAVWEYHNGKVPKGYHIHHKDENKFNNAIDNLECIPGGEHIALHAGSPEAWINSSEGQKHQNKNRELAKAWHASEAGLAWHKEHAAKCNFGKKEYGLTNCTWCGNEFMKLNARAKFCSGNCSTKQRKASGVDNVSRVCRQCNNSFSVNKYSSTAFCNTACAASFRYDK